MDGTKLAAKLSYGYGKAAQYLGTPYTQYRPASATAPMATALGTLSAAVKVKDKPFGAANKPENPYWDLMCQTSSVQVGDILTGAAGTFIIWQLPPIGAALAVQCNHIVAVHRPWQETTVGFNDLGGLASANETVLMSGWPASVRRDGKGEKSDTDLPGTGKVGNWMVLLPIFAGVTVQVADVIIRDVDNARLLVQLAEATDGWRFVAQEVSP